jgi:PAS domain S-box-containing protein
LEPERSKPKKTPRRRSHYAREGWETRVALIVSDEVGTQASVRQVLGPRFLLLDAPSIEKALAILISHEVDVVLLDAPVARAELLRAIADLHDAAPEAPIILLVVATVSSLVEEALEYGAFEALKKPFEAKALRSAVERAIWSSPPYPDEEDVPPEEFSGSPSSHPGDVLGGGTPQDAVGRSLLSALPSLRSLLGAVTAVVDVDAVASRTVEGMVDIFHAACVAFMVDKEGSGRFHVSAGRGLDRSTVRDLELDFRSSLVRQLVRSRQIFLRSTLGRFGHSTRISLKRELDILKAELAIPLWGEGRLIGLLALGNRVTGRPYDDSDLELMAAIGTLISSTLENALRYREVSQRETEYHVLLQDLESGVITVNREGLVTSLNPRAEEILGVEARRCIGKSAQKVSSVVADLLLRTLESGVPVRRHEFTYGKEGRLVGASTSLLRDARGRPEGAVMLFSDITREQEEQQRHVNQMKLAEIVNLSAWLAHQVKNPLVAIRTYTDLLPEKIDDEEFRESFASIVGGEVERLAGVIDALVSFGEECRLQRKPTELDKLAEEAVRQLQDRIKAAKLRVEASHKAARTRAEVDPGLLQSALSRLFGTVVDSAPEKSRLVLATRTYRERDGFRGSSDEERDLFEIRLYDPEKATVNMRKRETLFAPYQAAKPDYDFLGIALAHRIVREHEGWVEEGRTAKGEADLRVLIPLGPPEHAEGAE